MTESNPPNAPAKISIRPVQEADLQPLFDILYGGKADRVWMQFNGPYFDDPILTWPAFYERYRQTYLGKPERGQVIMLDKQIVGMVTAYFTDGHLGHWLEVGLVIAKQSNWGRGIGTQALTAWITELFTYYPELPHIGLTTWSGNPAMLMLAKKSGLLCEGRIRQVRYWQGQYYDSVKYGVLRSEWRPNSK